jgi:hypothetical protein
MAQINRRNRAASIGDQIMLRRFKSLEIPDRFSASAHMFADDVHLGIVPLGLGRMPHDTFSAHLIGEPEDVAKAKALLEELSEFSGHRDSELVFDAISAISKQLSWTGIAHWEIVKTGDAWKLWPVSKRRLFKFFFYFIQISPLREIREVGRFFCTLRSASVWRLRIPSELGGSRGFLSIIRELARFDSIMPAFSRRQLLGEDKTHTSSLNWAHDAAAYRNATQIHQNRITDKWGWNRRDYSNELCTEYYLFYKKLKFLIAQTLLRNHIVGELNHLFAELGVTCEIELCGFQNQAELKEIMKKFHAGELSIEQVSKVII